MTTSAAKLAKLGARDVTNDADAMKSEAERLQLINKQLEKIVTLTGDTDAVTGSKE